MTLAKVKEQDGIMLAKVKEQDGMMLAKVKEQDGMMLAKAKEQDGIMLANVKVPSIPTSAACCDDVQLTKLMRNPFPTPFTTVNYFIGLRPPNTATCSLLTLGACARVTVLAWSHSVHRATENSDHFYASTKARQTKHDQSLQFEFKP